jgi:photosystem II stability/assembly factor-like uncharacterized protein
MYIQCQKPRCVPHTSFLRGLWLSTFLIAATASAQWEILPNPSTADLRGIHNVGQGIAWASGTQGTILRTTNDGKDWQRCATPPEADKLDFRGIQAFDAKTAIVMSSGKGPLSRLYKTTDACQTWKLERSNSSPEGFWDALVFHDSVAPSHDRDAGELVGDPVNGHFVVFSKVGPNWFNERDDLFAPAVRGGEAAFAASNSSVLSFDRRDFMLGTGGVNGSRVIFFHSQPAAGSPDLLESVQDSRGVPIATGAESAGIFSLGMRDRQNIIAVGGDYLRPDDPWQIAASTHDGGLTWTASEIQPHGYRSAVAYDAPTKTWITVGPNGTDISTDDGRNWRALKPSASEPPDADQHWNALSLPFVVGPHGRIGKLRPNTLQSTRSGAKP